MLRISIAILFVTAFINNGSCSQCLGPQNLSFCKHCPRLEATQESCCENSNNIATLTCPSEAPYIEAVWFKICKSSYSIPIGLDCRSLRPSREQQNNACSRKGDCIGGTLLTM